MTTKSEGPGSRDPATAGAAGHGGQRTPIVWQVLSALLLLAMGGIHLALVFQWASGLLGVLFVLNAIGGLVLAIAMLTARRGLLRLASSLSLLFMAGTLLALVLALTVGPFGITERLSTALVVPTLVMESIGTVVLAITTAQMFRMRSEA
jgi:hypothetical protein